MLPAMSVLITASPMLLSVTCGALLLDEQRLFHDLALDRVAEGPQQPARLDLALDRGSPGRLPAAPGASASSSRPVSTTRGTRGAAHAPAGPLEALASGRPRSSRMMSVACSARYFSASRMRLDVGELGCVRVRLVEHLAEQAGVAGVVLDQEQDS